MKSLARPIASTIAVLSLLAGPSTPAHALSPDEQRAATEESRKVADAAGKNTDPAP